MSEVGYYRYKTSITTASKTIDFYKNGELVGSKTIVPISRCDGDLIIKYLDKNGQYRFFVFNKFHEIRDTPDKIGSSSVFITNILNAQTNKKNIGYRNQRQILVTAEASAEELLILEDLWSSPRIYLYKGLGQSDEVSDWIEIELSGDAVIKRRKNNFGTVSATINLPEHYSITML